MKPSNTPHQSGFTIIELIAVLVIIGILATLIVFSFSGVRSRDRDAVRQADIDTMQSHLEVFYAEHSRYPTLAQINDTNWLAQNMANLNADALADPSWSQDGSCANGDQAILVNTPAVDCYAYSPTSSDGEACDNTNVPCAHYTLTANLETDEEYIKTSLN